MARVPYFRLPILVPRSPVQHSLPPLVRRPARDDTALWIYGFLLLSLEIFRKPAARKIARKAIPLRLSGLPSTAKSDKLLYMWQGSGSSKPVSVPRGKIKARQKAAKAGRGKLYALYARTADEARSVIAGGRAKEAHELEGDLVNCALWQETYSPKADKPVFRCLMYAPACDPTTTARPPSQAKSGKKCITFQKLYSPKSKKKITRCKEYGMVKTGASCLPEPMPTPDREMYVPSRREIKALAKSMSDEKNAIEAEAGPWVAREIMSRGGIAPYRGKYLAEEYRAIPLHLKNKKGLPLDQMADELKTDERGLVEEIEKAYPKGEKKKRRFAAADFAKEAEVFLYRQHEQFGGIGKPGQTRLFGTLAGMVSCCLKWEKSGISPNGKAFYRCIEFAPTCSPPADACLKTKALKPGEDVKPKRKTAKKKPKPAPAPKKKREAARFSDDQIMKLLQFTEPEADPEDFVKRKDNWYMQIKGAAGEIQSEIPMYTAKMRFLPIGKPIIEQKKGYKVEYLTKISRETEKAIQIDMNRRTVADDPKHRDRETEKTKFEWLPKSQVFNLGKDMIFVPEWIIERKFLYPQALLRFEDL